MDSIHRVFKLYEAACDTGSEQAPCESIGDALQILQAVVWIAALTIVLAFAWADRVFRK
jgi:hypothetical protein